MNVIVWTGWCKLSRHSRDRERFGATRLRVEIPKFRCRELFSSMINCKRISADHENVRTFDFRVTANFLLTLKNLKG